MPFRLAIMERLLHVILFEQLESGTYDIFLKPAVSCTEGTTTMPIYFYHTGKGFHGNGPLFSLDLLDDLSCKHFRVRQFNWGYVLDKLSWQFY